MGSTQSSSSRKQDDSMPSNCICCLSPRPAVFKQLFQKLRRTLRRHLRPSKNRCGDFQRRCAARTALLRPMPRCSSFGSCGTLLTPTKRGKNDKKRKTTTPTDSHYAQWKCMFEHASGNGKQVVATAQRPHDISEALSGQTTPRGFPSHTDARRCPLPPLADQQPLYDCVGEIKVRRRLSFRLVRRMTARQRAAQAKLEAQLQRELCDLEDYYGGFHYARGNERRI
ncbi:protein nullo [Drosophila innubila]|uniref:protein nullo n=1 Tax=Drosophila innubila TaxID=198719 RepID=UPI00148C49F1|nr:protein nullo [Drosophila innubila]